MRPSAFEYHRAHTLDEALSLLAEFGEDGRPLAGGQSLVPMMNLRLARPRHLIDINSLPLDRIKLQGNAVHIGALVRHERYFDEPLMVEHFPAFLEAVHWIGHPTIRRHGTLGGSISHADPSAELPAACVLHDAIIIVRSTTGERRIPAADFFISAYVSAVQPGEMVIGVEIPLPRKATTGSFIEVAERVGDFSIAGVGAVLEREGDVVTDAKIVCTGAKLIPFRHREVEQFLIGREVTQSVAEEAGWMLANKVDPVGDHRATSEYRKNLINELTKRTLLRAIEARA